MGVANGVHKLQDRLVLFYLKESQLMKAALALRTKV